MTTEILIVSGSDVGERLDIFLSNELEGFSRSRVKKSIENGNVSVNEIKVNKGGVSLKLGDKVRIDIEEPTPITAMPQDLPLDIVYQDSDIAVINKAQGMVTHPAIGSPHSTLVNALMFHIKDLSSINGVIRPGIVHRLDKDTSGLIVVAKNDNAHHSLAIQIAKNTAYRKYIALVDGNIKEDKGSIDMPIGRSPSDRKKMAVVKRGGRNALTHFSVVERLGNYTLVEFQLTTGRTHQIRVHSKYMHRPIVGDTVYGGSNKFGLKGQLLHSHKLEVNHPQTGERMIFNAELPPYFSEIVQKLRNIKETS